jgi:hypothetical protein
MRIVDTTDMLDGDAKEWHDTVDDTHGLLYTEVVYDIELVVG